MRLIRTDAAVWPMYRLNRSDKFTNGFDIVEVEKDFYDRYRRVIEEYNTLQRDLARLPAIEEKSDVS